MAVGSIVDRPVCVDDRFEAREHICLTLSFDHDLIVGVAFSTGQFVVMIGGFMVISLLAAGVTVAVFRGISDTPEPT